jgi:hypothetical protein
MKREVDSKYFLREIKSGFENRVDTCRIGGLS